MWQPCQAIFKSSNHPLYTPPPITHTSTRWLYGLGQIHRRLVTNECSEQIGFKCSLIRDFAWHQ